MSEKLKTTLRKVDWKQTLDVPGVIAEATAVGKRNCKKTLRTNTDKVAHYKYRLAKRGFSAYEVVIVLLNVDDMYGGQLADTLMPDHNWQKIRNCGEVPFARGLVMRDFMQEALEAFDREAAAKLSKMTDVAVVVVDYQVAEIFSA